MRAVVVIFGSICVALVFVVEQLGAVLQLSMSLGAVSNGPLLGIFTMGVMIPWVHGRGALIGGATGIGVMSWICFKAQAAIRSGELTFLTKPTSTLGCKYHFIPTEPLSMLAINQTEIPIIQDIVDDEFHIYHISYIWYTLVGSFVTISVSLIASFALGANDPHKMDPKLFAPFLRDWMTGKSKTSNQRTMNEMVKPKITTGTEDDIRFASSIDLKAISQPNKA